MDIRDVQEAFDVARAAKFRLYRVLAGNSRFNKVDAEHLRHIRAELEHLEELMKTNLEAMEESNDD